MAFYAIVVNGEIECAFVNEENCEKKHIELVELNPLDDIASYKIETED